ncbi:MAG: 16S rRNA (guanine(966)-N(2))-methyltransferase RsmD [Algoriella sp.]
MRVITGLVKGRKLKTPDGEDVRPTTERTKEAVFSMIHYNVEQANFLDLFCGCGQMGLEALSRGAKKATFVDNDRDSQALTKENLISVGLFQKSNVLLQQSQTFLKGTKEVFDIAFLDPPYNKNIPQEILPLLVQKMSKNGIIILETEKKEIVPEKVDGSEFILTKQTHYGICKISVYTSSEINEQ